MLCVHAPSPACSRAPLTPFAAPPVLMVASKWQWDALFMFSHFGWKAASAVFFNALVLTWFFRHELAEKGHPQGDGEALQTLPLFDFMWCVPAHNVTLPSLDPRACHPAPCT